MCRSECVVGKQEVIQLSENADSDLGPAGSCRSRAFLSDGSSLVAYRLPIDLSGLPSEGRKPRYQKVPALRTPVHQRCAVEGPPVANCVIGADLPARTNGGHA